jgi:thioesterase domain-containing protein
VPNTVQLEAYVHEHTPISRHLGARVLAASCDQVRWIALLAPNLNHRQTAFGGSISALAILAGWSLLWVRLREHPPEHQIVIQSNSVRYLEPVLADFTATCIAPAPERWEQFTRTLAVRGRARIELHAEVRVEEQLVATFEGKYVVLTPGTRGGSSGSENL